MESGFIEIRRVLAPNNGIIPLFNLKYRATLKEMQASAIDFLISREKDGFDIIKECTKKL